MKRLVFPLLLAALMLLAACAADEATEPDSAAGTMIANPFTTCESLSAARKGAGFEITAPDTIGDSGEPVIRVMKGYMIELIYGQGAAEIRIRKAVGADDISGDYNSYADVSVLSSGGSEITVKGEDGMYSVAVWTDGEYCYSITADTPVSREFMLTLAGFVD